MGKNKLTIGGLCSGVGGIELGFRNAGFEISWANDMDRNCMTTYESIIGNNHFIGGKPQKIRNIIESGDIPDPVTVLASGFPCQAFSIAGERKGFEDARGTVIYDIIDFIKQYEKKNRPKVLFLENVKNFRKHDKENTYNRIVEELNAIDYSVYTKILNSCDYSNVPQNRERTYMTCFLGEENWSKFNLHNADTISVADMKEAINECPMTAAFHLNFPAKNSRANLVKIQSFLDEKVDEKYYYNKNQFNQYYKMLKEQQSLDLRTAYQIRRIYTRKNENDLCPTLTANMGTGGHNVPIVQRVGENNKTLYRKLTPIECFRFQGYGKYAGKIPYGVLADGQLYKQAGNSVTVSVVVRLAQAVRIALNSPLQKSQSPKIGIGSAGVFDSNDNDE